MSRMRMIGTVCAIALIAACGTTPKSEEDKKVQAAEVEATITKFKEKQPSVNTYIKDSYGWAVFPTVGKGGMGLGGAFGRGQVFEGGKMVGYTKLTSASIGFQLGGQSFSEVIFFENKAALDRFKSGEFGFDANASAVAANAGAAAKAEFKGGMAVFVMADAGLMYEASIGGQKFDYQPKE